MSQFTYLPVELRLKIFELLEDSDLLILGRVSLEMKRFVVSFNPGLYEVTLKGYKDYEKYLNSGMEISNIHIKEYPYQFYDPQIWKFLKVYAPFVKTLRVDKFNGCQSDAEFNFFSSFTALEELQISHLILGQEELPPRITPSNLQILNAFTKGSTELDQSYKKPNPLRIPQNFKTLKVLKIDTIVGKREREYEMELHKFCNNTTILRDIIKPSFDQPFSSFQNRSRWFLDSEKLKTLMQIVNCREQKVECIQMGLIWYKWIQIPTFDECLNFLQFCFDRGIKLKNLDSNVLKGGFSRRHTVPRELVDQTVISLIGFGGDCFSFGWSILEELTLHSSQFPYVGLYIVPRLPKLSILNLIFDTNIWDEEKRLRVERMVDILFPEGGANERTGLIELTLTFIPRNALRISNLTISRIVKNVPNLKKLKIVNWRTKYWETLFRGLSKLEELTVEESETFTDEALIGEDRYNPRYLRFVGNLYYPVFLKLKSLKKLELKLDFMKGLTDKAFKEVFSKMSLIELNLSGGSEQKPLRNVTLKGLRTLAKGRLSTSVRKLSFAGLFLAGVSTEELERLKSLFPFYK